MIIEFLRPILMLRVQARRDEFERTDQDGAEPHWRAILDDDGRVMVMITFNNDIADGWQRADEFYYPEEAANASIRLGVNFAVYALTH